MQVYTPVACIRQGCSRHGRGSVIEVLEATEGNICGRGRELSDGYEIEEPVLREALESIESGAFQVPLL